MRHPHGLRAASGVAGGNAWNIAAAEYNGTPLNSILISAQDTEPQGLFFKPDGTKVYVIGDTNNNVYEYNLSTAWDVSTASYLQSFSVAAQDARPIGLFFKPDGTKLYVIGLTNDSIYEYNLSTAWDISTTSYLQLFSVAAQDTVPNDLFFKPDGTKVYVIGVLGTSIYEYNLATAWDISTASYLQSFSVAAQGGSPQGLFFKPDGTKVYTIGLGDIIYEYNVSTPWDISTASYLQLFSVSDQETNSRGLFFKPDGINVYITGADTDRIYEYNLSTAWNIATASFIYPSTNYFSVAAQDTDPQGLFFKPDGTKIYIIGDISNRVYEYNLSTPWDISTASYLQFFSVAAQDTLPQGLFFKPDGTKFYITGAVNDRIYEYNLSVAWDISTASYLQFFSVTAQDTGPQDLFFKPDGNKVYVVGAANDRVYEYNLATSWDISTASYLQLFSVAAQDTLPQGLFFKPDGTKFYITGAVNDRIYEYNLSVLWDISTASYLQFFSMTQQTNVPAGLFFKPNGTKVYITDTGINASMWSYDM